MGSGRGQCGHDRSCRIDRNEPVHFMSDPGSERARAKMQNRSATGISGMRLT